MAPVVLGGERVDPGPGAAVVAAVHSGDGPQRAVDPREGHRGHDPEDRGSASLLVHPDNLPLEVNPKNGDDEDVWP